MTFHITEQVNIRSLTKTWNTSAFCSGLMDARGAARGPTKAGSGQDPCLDAFSVALKRGTNESGWYASTKELQRASLQFCRACRVATSLTLRVDEKTPSRLLGDADPLPPKRKKSGSSRVPRLRAFRVRWNLPTAAELSSPIYAVADATEIGFGDAFVDGLQGIVWPDRLQALHFGTASRFDKAIDGVEWPKLLHRMMFGRCFNQPLEGVQLPALLERLTFGSLFNQPIEGVLFPAPLRRMTFGASFNQPIERLQWPKSLCRLTFGKDFNQPIGGVLWPDSMKRLTFGDRFNQPLEGGTLPASLEELSLGTLFNKPVEAVKWPDSMKVLTFGEHFNQPIELTVWPDSVTRLSFGQHFNRPIDKVNWPVALHSLSFGFVDHRLSSGDKFSMWSHFTKSLHTAKWPTSLRRFAVGGEFLQPLDELSAWMPHLEEFTILVREWCPYGSFMRPIGWPKGLRKLTVHDDVDPGMMSLPEGVQVVCLLRDKWERW